MRYNTKQVAVFLALLAMSTTGANPDSRARANTEENSECEDCILAAIEESCEDFTSEEGNLTPGFFSDLTEDKCECVTPIAACDQNFDCEQLIAPTFPQQVNALECDTDDEVEEMDDVDEDGDNMGPDDEDGDNADTDEDDEGHGHDEDCAACVQQALNASECSSSSSSLLPPHFLSCPSSTRCPCYTMLDQCDRNHSCGGELLAVQYVFEQYCLNDTARADVPSGEENIRASENDSGFVTVPALVGSLVGVIVFVVVSGLLVFRWKSVSTRRKERQNSLYVHTKNPIVQGTQPVGV